MPLSWRLAGVGLQEPDRLRFTVSTFTYIPSVGLKSIPLA